MGADGAGVRLQAWRAQGADRLDPLRFAFLQALADRAARHAGRARDLLDERLAVMLDAYARDLDRAAPTARAPADDAAPASALGALLAHIGGAHRTDAPVAPEAPAAMPALDELRAVWSRLRNDSQLRESLEQVPVEAGPLNSDMLVHRALQLMQGAAPGYLRHFIAYADTLASLQLLRDSAGTAGDAAVAAGHRKPARARPRRRTG